MLRTEANTTACLLTQIPCLARFKLGERRYKLHEVCKPSLGLA
jgi:hypothetical protein